MKAWIAAHGRELASDTIALGGAGAIAYGASLYSQPAGFIVGGLFAIGLVVLDVLVRRAPAPPKREVSS